MGVKKKVRFFKRKLLKNGKYKPPGRTRGQGRGGARPPRPDASPGERYGECAQGVDTWIRVNDPSAGSPTETLLRLLLPLNDQV